MKFYSSAHILDTIRPQMKISELCPLRTCGNNSFISNLLNVINTILAICYACTNVYL